ncbi:putative ribonuclease H-like domain-containing protein [Tanacetum coccineum]
MQEELLQFKLQKVWTPVDLLKGKRAIGTKWVYKNKKDERGIVVRNKARLVAHGYTQEEGIDYDEVFAHVARIEEIRLFLPMHIYDLLCIPAMDVKSAFLYGTIEEDVYVCQPPSFEDPQFPDKVYKVEKALYGLHQAPRAWYETLSTYLLENGYKRGNIDKTLFIKKDRGDILLVQMSSMGELTFFLGLQVQQKEDGIFISQDSLKLALVSSGFTFVWKLSSDSDYAGASLDRKSTTGGCQFLGKRFEAASKQSNDLPLSRVNTLGSGEESMKLMELMEHYTKLSELKTSQLEDSDEAATMPHDSPLLRVHSLESDEGSMTLNELMVLCTTLSKKVETLESDLKQTKLTYGAAYTKLIMKVKKLEQMSAQIGEHEIDFEEFDFEFIALEEDYTAKPDISTANVPVSTADAEVNTTSPEVKTVIESLVYIRRSAAKRKDKGKAIMKEAELVQRRTMVATRSKKDLVEAARRLQKPLDERRKERIAEFIRKLALSMLEKWIIYISN